MQTREIVVVNPLGLHARACARIVELASRFRCRVSLVIGKRRASAESILAIMMLAATVGTTVRIETDGPDESAAMSAMVALFAGGLDVRA